MDAQAHQPPYSFSSVHVYLSDSKTSHFMIFLTEQEDEYKLSKDGGEKMGVETTPSQMKDTTTHSQEPIGSRAMAGVCAARKRGRPKKEQSNKSDNDTIARDIKFQDMPKGMAETPPTKRHRRPRKGTPNMSNNEEVVSSDFSPEIIKELRLSDEHKAMPDTRTKRKPARPRKAK